MDKYFLYLHLKMVQVLESEVSEQDYQLIIKKKQQQKKQIVKKQQPVKTKEAFYIDDFNNKRSFGNLMKGKNTEGIYISDDIMYDQVSKIKEMLRENGFIAKSQLTHDIYVLQKLTGITYTIDTIKNSNENITNEMKIYINRIQRELRKQNEEILENHI